MLDCALIDFKECLSHQISVVNNEDANLKAQVEISHSDFLGTANLTQLTAILPSDTKLKEKDKIKFANYEAEKSFVVHKIEAIDILSKRAILKLADDRGARQTSNEL